MRILTVSAHYPPNFVSGGTLQPQRLSRALAALGHDVSVYAGWIGERRPLETWTDVDETGLSVRWVVSSPWIGWSDERNWRNPAVTADFRAHLAEVRPDVVHVHALQSLGAELVTAAREAGAKVVVTMHDFWWLCSRQFLVDRDQRPCCLVVEAGVCPCEVDVDWRRQRGEALAGLLGGADLVLAPSAAAVAVLEANGVAPGRLAVDENGLPEADATSRAPRGGERGARRTDPDPDADHGDVRLLYTGGPNPMKGIDVLIDAAEAMAGVPGWRLAAYGAAEYLERSGRTVEGLPIDVRDPFAPQDLAGVLAANDVFVLPSVMRETYSIATREALDAGLPVVCTDTLGPEEVVTHGTNGLVVAAADAAALAEALTRVVTDPGLRDRLHEGAAAPVPVRTIGDQAAGLEQRFEELIAAAPSSAAGPTSAVSSVLFVCGIEGAPLRYRARLPAEALARVGVSSEVRHYRDPELAALGSGADVVVFYRVPATVQVLELIDGFHRAAIPCVFDVDDLIFDPELRDEIPALRLLPPAEAELWLQGVNRYRTTLEACDAYVGSTDQLVHHASTLTGLASHQFDNGVGLLLARRADAELRRPRRPGPVRLGYLSGTNTHDEDWFFVEPAVVAVLDAHADVELWLGGHLPPSSALAPFGDRVRRLPFAPWLELPAVLRDLDVNLSPLAPGSRFNEAKSAIKWLEAALCATPTVASPTRPFRDAIQPGRTGLLADSVDEWRAALELLVTDEGERARIGDLARRRALLEWSPARQGARYRAILDAVAAAGPRDRSSGWAPVALDEPPMAVELEPYTDASVEPGESHAEVHAPVDPADGVTSGGLDRAAGLARRGMASLRTDGVGVTSRKAVGKIRRRFGTTGRAPEEAPGLPRDEEPDR